MDDDAVGQENNGVENLLKRLIIQGSWLETCGPSSLESIVAFHGIDMGFLGPCQPSDVFTMLMHDYRYSKLDKPLPMHRYLDSYPPLIEKLFPTLKGEVILYDGKDPSAVIRGNIPCMVNLISPAHYIACLSIDGDVVTYNESWMNDKFNPGSSRIRTILLSDLVKNVKYGILAVRKVVGK